MTTTETAPVHPPLSSSTSSELRSLIDGFTTKSDGIPGCVFNVVNRNGEQIFTHASGKRGIEENEPMTLDSIFWIASCTKLVTVIAAMQLVEKGELALDDADQAETLCPEFKGMKILTGFDDDDKPVWKDKEKRITLRMLLSHTAGFGYSFFNNTIRRFGYPTGFQEFSGYAKDVTDQPLVSEPGSGWEYSTGLDWVALMIERTTKLNLDEYFEAHILEPLGISDTTCFPTPSMKLRLAHNHFRAGSKLLPYDHLRRCVLVASESEKKEMFCGGGHGLFSKPTEYCKILVALMNGGTSPETKKSILSSQSVETMLENQIPHLPNFGRKAIPDAKPDQTNPIPEIYPQPHDQPQGWCFAGFQTIHPAPTGRGKNGVQWAGLSNLFWWLDREKGVAGMIASQILPFGDPEVLGLWVTAESAVYKALAEGQK